MSPGKKLAHSRPPPPRCCLSRPSQNTQLETTAAKVLSLPPPNIYLCPRPVTRKERDDGTFQLTLWVVTISLYDTVPGTCPEILVWNNPLFMHRHPIRARSRARVRPSPLPPPSPYRDATPICCRSDIGSFPPFVERGARPTGARA